MHAPSTAEILDIWDEGSNLDHTGRALLLLNLTHPGHTGNEDRDLTIGKRDGMLLDVRESLFGPRIDAVDQCAACGAQVEVSFEIAQIRRGAMARQVRQLMVREGEYEIEVRLPTSADLLSIRGCESADEGRNLLLARCVTRAQIADTAVDPSDLPESVQHEIACAMEDADPLASIELILACAACGHNWRRQFDVVDYLWAEIVRFARRTLCDVHLLARHYGWSEDAIIGLTPVRRRRYLELVDNG